MASQKCTSSSQMMVNEETFKRVGRGMKVNKETLIEPWFVVQRSYYSNKDAPDFQRVVSTVKGENMYCCSCGISINSFFSTHPNYYHSLLSSQKKLSNL